MRKKGPWPGSGHVARFQVPEFPCGGSCQGSLSAALEDGRGWRLLRSQEQLQVPDVIPGEHSSPGTSLPLPSHSLFP